MNNDKQTKLQEEQHMIFINSQIADFEYYMHDFINNKEHELVVAHGLYGKQQLFVPVIYNFIAKSYDIPVGEIDTTFRIDPSNLKFNDRLLNMIFDSIPLDCRVIVSKNEQCYGFASRKFNIAITLTKLT